MTSTTTEATHLPAIGRREARHLAAEEYRRMADQLASLGEPDWSRPTDCTGWDVRDLAAHVVGGTEAFASTREFVHQMRSATADAKRDGVEMVDAMTARQVAERADLGTEELCARMAAAGPRAARWRSRFPLRFLPLKQEVGGVVETWRMGYLLDVILTRDTWMHRVDIARATGRPLELSVDHDGRLVADVVAEWARRHGRPFALHLEGPAGGTFVQDRTGTEAQGPGGEDLRVDAVEFCRILSGRADGEGLLAQEVPF